MKLRCGIIKIAKLRAVSCLLFTYSIFQGIAFANELKGPKVDQHYCHEFFSFGTIGVPELRTTIRSAFSAESGVFAFGTLEELFTHYKVQGIDESSNVPYIRYVFEDLDAEGSQEKLTIFGPFGDSHLRMISMVRMITDDTNLPPMKFDDSGRIYFHKLQGSKFAILIPDPKSDFLMKMRLIRTSPWIASDEL